MAKKLTYKYNRKTLKYEKVRITFKQKFLKVASYLATGLVFSIVVIILAYNFLDSPKEKIYQREISQYKMQYEILNDRLKEVSMELGDIQNRDDRIYRAIFEADPIPNSIRKAGYGGVDRYAELEGFKNSELIIETTKKIDQISRQLYVQSVSFDKIAAMIKDKKNMMACIPAIQPISNKDLRRIASGFGYRIHPIYKTLRMHTGIDFAAPIGTPIYATGDATVSTSREGLTGYGLCCVLNHGYGYQTLYGHMQRIVVRPGQKVKRGQIIGYVGNTGMSVEPHVHYEVIKNGQKINPINFFYNDLTPEEYEKLIEIASRVNQSMS